MTSNDKPLYCSTTCEGRLMVRSFRACSLCGLKWDSTGSGKNYCNGAWQLCVDCAKAGSCCVVCGERVPDAPRSIS